MPKDKGSAHGLDGKGFGGPKEETPQESVNKSVKTDVPGGESKKGTWIDTNGPHPGSGHAGRRS